MKKCHAFIRKLLFLLVFEYMIITKQAFAMATAKKSRATSLKRDMWQIEEPEFVVQLVGSGENANKLQKEINGSLAFPLRYD